MKIETFYAELWSRSLGPTKMISRVDGNTTFVWHVDDDNDRYVEITSSLYDDVFVCVLYDGFHKQEAVVATIPLGEYGDTVLTWLRTALVDLSSRPQSPRGRPSAISRNSAKHDDRPPSYCAGHQADGDCSPDGCCCEGGARCDSCGEHEGGGET